MVNGLTKRTNGLPSRSLSIGQRVKNRRLELHLTLPDLADKAKISKSVLFQLENSETLNKVAKALGVTIAMLLDKPGIKAKRVIPDHVDQCLKQMIASLKKERTAVNQAAIDALYVLQEREGAPKTEDDWRWLYDTISLKLNQRKR